MVKFFSISMLLCSAVSYNVVNACQVPGCEFNSKNPKYADTVTTITAPDESMWRAADQLDEEDAHIFAKKSIPYNFQDINQAPQGSVYVIKNDFIEILSLSHK